MQDGPVSASGPIGPIDFATAGVFFLLREIELAAAKLGHLSFVEAAPTSVTWLLPSSKTDCRAVGVSRTLDCTCKIASLEGCCPVNALLRQRDRVRGLASELGKIADEMPLFPNTEGNEVVKAAAVETIFRLVALSGGKVRDSKGNLLFGGHSLRTGGASLLASLGVSPLKIQAMGRWRSPLVIYYAGEALATGVVRDMAIAASTPLAAVPSSGPRRGREPSLVAFHERLSALEGLIRQDPPPAPDPGGGGEVFILAVGSSCIHRVRVGPEGPEAQTLCRWAFSNAEVEVLTEFNNPHHHQCDECFNLDMSDFD